MKTTVDRGQLLAAVRLSSEVADQRSPVLMYQAVLMGLGAAGCELTATNGRETIRSVVGEAGETKASVCVNAKRLVDAISHMPEGAIRMECVGADLVVSSGRATIKIATSSSGDFPASAAPVLEQKVDRAALMEALRRVVFVANPTNPANDVNSIRVEIAGGRLTTWSLNGHVLGVDVISTDLPPVKASLHVDSARAFISVLDGSEAEFVTASIGDSIAVSAGGSTIWGTSSGAAHQPWGQLIPEKPLVISCGREELLAAIGRAALFAAKEKPNIDLCIQDDGLHLSSAGFAATGSATTCIDIDGDKKSGTAVSVSWRYLRDVLSAIDAERVDIAISTPVKPIVIRPAGVSDGQMYLIAPMDRR